MTGLALRRDRAPGPTGLAAAIVSPLLAVAAVTLLAYSVSSFDSSMEQIVLLFGINAIMVVGYQLFVGNTGIVSFGHVAFMAIGAYAGGISAISVADKELFLPDLPGIFSEVELTILPAMIVGGIAAAIVAFAFGIALMRLSGAAASIATLGLLVIVNNVLNQSTSITRAPQSLFGIPDSTSFFWVFTALAGVVCISAAFKWSRAGLRARATRDDPIASEAAGVPLLRARLWAFVLSAFITGIGGALYAQLLTAFSPGSFFVPQIVVILTMGIIGGINSITGAITGAALITVLNEVLRRVEGGLSLGGLEIQAPTGISVAVLGVALILMLRWRPEGLLGAEELQIETERGGRPSPAPGDRPAPKPATEGSQ